MANFIGRLGVVLGLDSAEFSRGLDTAGKKLESFSNNAEKYGKVAAVALLAAGAAALKYADDIADVAAANEVAIDSVLKLRNGLANAGGSADGAGKLLAKFTDNIDKAAEGGFEVQQTFKKMGLSLDDLRKMDIDTMFNKAVEGLAGMTDPITRNAKAMELFGKASKGVDFVELNEQLKTGAGVSNEQAQGIKAAAEAYDLLAQATRDFTTVLAAELGPPLKATLEYIQNIKSESSVMGAVLKVVFETIAILGANVAFVIEGIAREIGDTIEKAKLLAKFDFAGINALNQKAQAEFDQRAAKLEAFERRIMGDGGSGRGFMRGDEGMPKAAATAAATIRRAVKPGIDKEAEAAAKKALDLALKGFTEAEREREANRIAFSERAGFLEKGNAALIMQQALEKQTLDREKERLILADQGRNMRSEDLQFAEAALEIEYKRLDAVKAINANDALDRPAREEALIRNNALAAQALELEKKRLELTQQMRQGSLAEGFKNAAETTFRDASTQFERGQKMFESVMGNMESAIDKFVRTGKLSFKDFARSIIVDLIAIQLKAQAVSLFKMAFGSFGSTASTPAGFADGGDPPVGKASVVGERGPELFVPRTAGTIIPNHALNSMGSTNNVTNNYINAIDTKSFEERLFGSSNAIWAANQYANKSLMINRGRA
jgi:lambda family phage tail tape measure protein